MWCRPPPLGRPMLKPRAPLPGSPLGSPVGRLCEGGTAARPCVSPRLSASEFARLPVSRGFPSRLGSCPPYGPLHTWHSAQLNIFLVGIGLGNMLVSVPYNSQWYCLQAVANNAVHTIESRLDNKSTYCLQRLMGLECLDQSQRGGPPVANQAHVVEQAVVIEHVAAQVLIAAHAAQPQPITQGIAVCV